MVDTDHSVQGYLQRRTTEELQCILAGYLNRPLIPVEEDIVEMILDILLKRLQK